MTSYSLAGLQAQFGGHLSGHPPAFDGPIEHWLYDSRHQVPGPGAVFLALPGPHRDGHGFIGQAYQKGVRLFWVAQPIATDAYPDAAFWQVPDVLAALQRLAAHHRAQFQGTVVGITGSNGKTTVKEWLTTLLEGQFDVYKSPRSYNSQLGVALALLGLRPHHQVALIECGISQVGEMARLAAMVQPSFGVLTHLGDAHANGFADGAEKVAEKLALFPPDCPVVSFRHGATYTPLVERHLAQRTAPVVAPSVGTLQLTSALYQSTTGSWEVTLEVGGTPIAATAPIAGEAGCENLVLALASAHLLGLRPEQVSQRSGLLRPLELRTQLLTDNPEVVVLADAYNADIDSIRNAVALLLTQRQLPTRRLILSDIEHLGRDSAELHAKLVRELSQALGAEHLELIGPQFTAAAAALGATEVQVYPSVAAYLARFEYHRYRGAVVLVKGARRFELEQILPRLARHSGPTVLQINLNAAIENLRTLQAPLPPGTGTVVMLKAGAYGTGAWQLAQALVPAGVAYLGVAQPYEGIELRERGITAPILVLYPDPTLQQCASYDLEPVISGWAQVEALVALDPATYPLAGVHLEFDTGMARLGFSPAEAAAVTARLAQQPVPVATCFTHLAASEDPAQDAFTRSQLSAFAAAAAQVRLRYPGCKRHALNTGGALRFPEAAYELVRLGIGLYGIDPRGPATSQLREIGSLRTVVAQLHTYPAGTSVGYGRAEVLQAEARIATLPLGYADGLPRSVGERRFSVLIRGQRAPIVGRVCMDVCMAEVTHIAGVAEGDEAVVFGAQGTEVQSIEALAQASGTIAYEVLARIPARVRRVYLRE
ncbi:MAG: alanine racemase [Bacteroidia bacterium]|nr:alanine racemase [Bacteroidia bacterium]